MLCDRKCKTVIFITNAQDMESVADSIVTFDIADAKHISMSEADKDNDGLVSLQEYEAAGGQVKHFNRFDLDGDGVLDAHEQQLAELATKRARAGSKPASPTGSPDLSPAAAPEARAQEIELELRRLSSASPPPASPRPRLLSEDMELGAEQNIAPPQMQVRTMDGHDDETKRYLEEVDVIVGH